MLSYKKTKKNPKRFLALTGVTVEEFEELLGAFQAAWEEYIQREHIDGKERQRAYGGGRKPLLKALAEKLFFILSILFQKIRPLSGACVTWNPVPMRPAAGSPHRSTRVPKSPLLKRTCAPTGVPAPTAANRAGRG